LRSPDSIQEGQGANYGHLLLRVHDRRTPGETLIFRPFLIKMRMLFRKPSLSIRNIYILLQLLLRHTLTSNFRCLKLHEQELTQGSFL
jgi:hypothetical protein